MPDPVICPICGAVCRWQAGGWVCPACGWHPT